MKLTKKKMIMSGLALLLALVLLGTASLAWFTISTNPEITGIKLNIFTDKSILISDDGMNFDDSTVISFDRYVPLTPVSTVDGQNWFLPAYNDDGSLKDSTEFILDDNLTHANVLRYAPLEPDSVTGVVPEYDITKNYPELEGAELMEAYKKGYYLYTDIYLKTELEEGATVRLSNPTPTPSLEKEDYPDLTDEEFQEFRELQEEKEFSDWAKKKGVDGSYVVPRYVLYSDAETGTDSLVNISQQAESSVRVGFLVNPSHVGSSRADYMYTAYLNEEPSEDGLGLGENPQDVFWAEETEKTDVTPRTRTVITEEGRENAAAPDAVGIVSAFLKNHPEELPEGTPLTWELIGTVPCTSGEAAASDVSLTVKDQDGMEVSISGKTTSYYTLDEAAASEDDHTAQWTVTEYILFTSDDTLNPFVSGASEKLGTVPVLSETKKRSFIIYFTWTEGEEPVPRVLSVRFPETDGTDDTDYRVTTVYTADETGSTVSGDTEVRGVWTSKENLGFDSEENPKVITQESTPAEVQHDIDNTEEGITVDTYSAETKKITTYYSGDVYEAQENRFVIYEPNADKRSAGPESLITADSGQEGKPDKKVEDQSDRYVISYYIQDEEYREGNYIVTRPIGIDGTRIQKGTDEDGNTVERTVPNFIPISLERSVIGNNAETYLDRLIIQRMSIWDKDKLKARIASGSLGAVAADPLFYFKNALRFVTNPENADDPNYGLSSCISAMGRFLRVKTVYEELQDRALSESYQKELFAESQQEVGDKLYTKISGTDQDAAFNASSSVNVSDTIVVKLQQDVPVKIRLFVWIEGQDVDCWNDIASGSFHMNLEFAATDGGLVQTEENEGK